MIEDRIKISNQHYSIVTNKDNINQISSKVYIESSSDKTIIVEVDRVISNTDDIEFIMKTFHKKILSSFMRFVHKHRNYNQKKLNLMIKEKLSKEQISIKVPKNIVKNIEKREITTKDIEEWNTLCKQHLPNNILGAYKKRGETLLKYNRIQENITDDEKTIESIQKFLNNEKNNIVNLIGNIKIKILTIGSKLYFIFHLDSDTTIFIIAPDNSSVGIYMKYITSFKNILK